MPNIDKAFEYLLGVKPMSSEWEELELESSEEVVENKKAEPKAEEIGYTVNHPKLLCKFLGIGKFPSYLDTLEQDDKATVVQQALKPK